MEIKAGVGMELVVVNTIAGKAPEILRGMRHNPSEIQTPQDLNYSTQKKYSLARTMENQNGARTVQM